MVCLLQLVHSYFALNIREKNLSFTWKKNKIKESRRPKPPIHLELALSTYKLIFLFPVTFLHTTVVYYVWISITFFVLLCFWIILYFVTSGMCQLDCVISSDILMAHKYFLHNYFQITYESFEESIKNFGGRMNWTERKRPRRTVGQHFFYRRSESNLLEFLFLALTVIGTIVKKRYLLS